MSTSDDHERLLEESPRPRLHRRRDRLVLPNWAWPVLGMACLAVGLILGWLLWTPGASPETPTPSPTATVPANTATFTRTPPAPTATATQTPLPTSTPTSTLTPTETGTPLPTETPTPELTITVGGRVKVGDTGGANLRLRAGPGSDFITFKIIEDGAILEVLGGPEKADGHVWWRLKDSAGVIGWAAADWLIPIP